MRIGHGYDVHRLVNDRPLLLGGVRIPYDKGLLGHSDADVLIHAIIDAILGASGEGDIGKHFPDNSKEFSGISSLILLERTVALLEKRGFLVYNLDSTILAQEPKLSGYISGMETNIARIIGTDRSLVNVKATTTEGLGFTGRGEGIAAFAVVSIGNWKLETGNWDKQLPLAVGRLLREKVKFSELVRLLEKNGFTIVKEKGSIRYYGKSGWNTLVRVDFHGSKEIPKGTCHAILKASGIK